MPSTLFFVELELGATLKQCTLVHLGNLVHLCTSTLVLYGAGLEAQRIGELGLCLEHSFALEVDDGGNGGYG